MTKQSPRVPEEEPRSTVEESGSARLMAVANTALVGIPAAYVTSNSVVITVITAVVALGFVVLARWAR